MSKLHNDLSRYNLVLNQFLVEEADKLNKENTESKITPEELIKKIMILQPAQVLSFITKQMGEKTGAELILKNSPSLAASILKHGFYKAKDLGKSIKDFGKKNIEDNSKIDFENVEIDTDTLKTIYVFDGDSIQKLEEFIKQYQESMKDIEAEASKAGEKLKSDVQSKKVKVSDETLDNNGLTVAGVIKNPENKNKSGKELTKEINQRVELENEIADSMKTTQEQLKKLDKLNLPEISEKDIEAAYKDIDSTDNKASDDSDDYNKRYEEIHKIEETITKSIKNKLGKDYQSSLDVKIYPTAVFKKSIEQKIPKIVIDAIKARYTLGVRIDFFGDESDTVLEADEEGRYVVKLVKDDEKNPDIKKIVDTFKNLIKSNVDSKDIEGKIYAYLKYWKGENPDANFDSLFIFMGFTKFNIKESLDESNMINEADTTPDFEELSQAMAIKIAKICNSNNIPSDEAYKAYEDWLYDALDKLDLDSDEAEKIRELAELVFEHAITDPKQAIEDFSISKQALEIADKMSSFDPIDGEIEIESYRNDIADAVADAADKVTNTAGKIEKLNDIKQNGGNFKVRFTREDRLNPKIFPPDDKEFNPMRELRELKSPRMEPNGVANQLRWFKNRPDSESIRSRLLQSLTKQDEQIKKWNNWIDTLSEEDLDNPKTRANIAMMKQIEEEYNKLKETATSALKSAEIEDSTEYISDSVNTEGVDKESIAELSNNEETKEMTKGFLGKIGSGLKSFMNVIAVAKIAKFVLNHGKTFTDVLGAQVVKFKEDKNIIAEVTCILNNEEGSDSNYSDTKFSVRFDVNDLKWHATNLDNRKMKITNEEALIKKIMEVQEVKDFKKQCLDAWSKIFDVKTKQDAIIPYFLRNYEKLGMKINDKNMKKYIESLVKVADNFETIKKQFEGN